LVVYANPSLGESQWQLEFELSLWENTVVVLKTTVYKTMLPERHERRANFDEIIANAKELVFESGHHVPVVIMEGSKNLIVSSIQELPPTYCERMQLMRFMGQAAAKSGQVGSLEQVFMISEGWMSMARQDSPPKMRPAEDPNRKEVLIISGFDIQQKMKKLKLFEMVRDQHQHVIAMPEILPPQSRDGKVEIPLLDAFAEGFLLAFRARVN